MYPYGTTQSVPSDAQVALEGLLSTAGMAAGTLLGISAEEAEARALIRSEQRVKSEFPLTVALNAGAAALIFGIGVGVVGYYLPKYKAMDFALWGAGAGALFGVSKAYSQKDDLG